MVGAHTGGTAADGDSVAACQARATMTRRLCTIAAFYRYAAEEELPDHSPAAHVRRAGIDYESQATGPDRNELGALLVAAASPAIMTLPTTTCSGLIIIAVGTPRQSALGRCRDCRSHHGDAQRLCLHTHALDSIRTTSQRRSTRSVCPG